MPAMAATSVRRTVSWGCGVAELKEVFDAFLESRGHRDLSSIVGRLLREGPPVRRLGLGCNRLGGDTAEAIDAFHAATDEIT